MGVFRLDIAEITGNPSLTVNVYRPVVDDASHPYGIAQDWDPMGTYPAWHSNTARSEYGGDGGIDAAATTTVYIQGVAPLPPRVGVQIAEQDKIKASLSVDNYFDIDGRYVYSIVVI